MRCCLLPLGTFAFAFAFGSFSLGRLASRRLAMGTDCRITRSAFVVIPCEETACMAHLALLAAAASCGPSERRLRGGVRELEAAAAQTHRFPLPRGKAHWRQQSEALLKLSGAQLWHEPPERAYTH